MFRTQYHIHFVGIGGIGMSGIAELLLNLGYTVSGSDIRLTDITERLEQLGGMIREGHDESYIAGADVVVISSAVSQQNPEVVQARQWSIPVIPRAEMLAELMRLKYSVAIAGAHGKTTTTSLVAWVLAQGGFDPTVVIGGKLKNIGSNALLGKGDFMVAEADESDGSFLKMFPTIAVVTNIDKEHLDYYRDLDDIKQAFVTFVDHIPFYGLAVLCLDNEAVQELIPRIGKRFITYGISTQADIQARNVVLKGLSSEYTLLKRGEVMGSIRLNLPGMHNVFNSLAAAAVGFELDINFDQLQRALETVPGVQRRMEIKGELNGVKVIDDYGHHPTEIKATLQALKESLPESRLVVVFQPHRYSRTKALFEEFTRAFYQADMLAILPIYAASEVEILGMSSMILAAGIQEHGHKNVEYVENFEQALDYVDSVAEPGDVLLTLGAGNVTLLGDVYLCRDRK